MPTITVKQLKMHEACQDQVIAFKEAFSDAITVETEEDAVRIAKENALRFDWDWAAGNLLSWAAKMQFNKAKAPLLKQYFEAVTPLSKRYKEGEAMLLQYKEGQAALLKQYKEGQAPLWKQYKEGQAALFARLWFNQEV